MTSTSASNSEALIARAQIYRFLARLFLKELDRAMIINLQEPDTRAWLAEVGVVLGEEWIVKSTDALAEFLATEYCRLFIGPGQHHSPHESIHHPREDGDWGNYWGRDTVQVKAFVESLGLSYQENFTAMPDHLSAELELMAALADAIAIREQTGDSVGIQVLYEQEKRFFTEHLGAWAPNFLEKVKTTAEKGFYYQIATLTLAFLESEMERLIDA